MLNLQKAAPFTLALTLTSACSLDQFKKDPVYERVELSCQDKAMIDDGEDRNDQILVRDGRGGYFYTFVDSAGSSIEPGAAFKMDKPGGNDSKYAVHIKGQLAAGGEVYAGVGLDFRSPRGPYNASKYKGVAFLAKTAASGGAQVRFGVPDVNTDPAGKVCTECFNNFGINVDLTDQWTRFEVPFTEMHQQPAWGNPRPEAIDVSKLISLTWQISAPGTTYDVWIDDITFIGCP